MGWGVSLESPEDQRPRPPSPLPCPGPGYGSQASLFLPLFSQTSALDLGPLRIPPAPLSGQWLESDFFGDQRFCFFLFVLSRLSS